MIPILYDKYETEFETNGICRLIDCITCEATEERNGIYEVEFKYPVDGRHFDEIEIGRIIFASHDETGYPQPFDIYKRSAEIDGIVTFNASHVSYRLGSTILQPFTASTCIEAITKIPDNALDGTRFSFWTDKSVTANFKLQFPQNIRATLSGTTGSILDVYGTGEWHYDNYHCALLLHRGVDRNVSIRYGKNLTELSQILDMSKLATGIIPYAINPDTHISIAGTRVPTGLTLDVSKDSAVDFSDDINWESGTTVLAQLATLASAYVAKYSSELTTIANSFTLSFAQLNEIAERIDLCDTVHIYFEALGINASAKCIACTWDVLADRYISNTFGDQRQDIASTMANMQTQLNETPTSAEMSQAINYKADKISGNLGGYVINGYDSNGDGYPDENLVLDTPDIGTAVKVVRMNNGGIGVSNTGYNGSYTNAITGDGINADAIKVGIISDVNGRSEIDMTSGVAKLYELKAIKGFTVVTQGDEDPRAEFTQDQWSTKLLMSHNDVSTPDIELIDYSRSGTEYSQLRLSNDDGTTYTATLLADNDGGHVVLKNANGNDAIKFFANGTYGGNWYLYNTNGNNRFHAFVGSINDDGILDVFDGSGTVTISLVGKDGVIECGSVKPKNQIVSLWTGTLNGTPGNDEVMVPYGPYSAYLVKFRTSTNGYYQTMLIPRIDLQDNIQDTYQFNTESQYYTFYADYVDNTAYFTFRGRSSGSTAHICAIYGIY